MIAALLAATLAQAAAPSIDGGDWLVVAVGRVIAPDQHPGECFVQGRVERVVRGRAFCAGQAVALTIPCRAGGATPTALGPSEPPTLDTLRREKRALVHVDAGGRLLDNGYWPLGEG